MNRRRIVPLILTCERNLDVTRRFTSSFQTIRDGVAPPVVVRDESAGGQPSAAYLDCIDSLAPASVHVHPREAGLSLYDSVQCAAQFALERALEGTAEEDRVLFLEDDIVFACRFVEELHAIGIDHDTGFITLYLPGNGFGGPEVNPEHFYGTQCLLLPRWSVESIVRERDYIFQHFMPGYDIRWSRFLAHRGYKLWQTMTSLVQHLDFPSRLHDDAPSHSSLLFGG